MILSGRISKENANKLGYQSPFSFRLVAGLNKRKEVVNAGKIFKKKIYGKFKI